MSHEIVTYGIIEGATWRTEEYRKYQIRNLEIISQLPEDNEWPWLPAGMFSSADPDCYRGTFRRQILHFGASTKEHGNESVEQWIRKYESLLAQLYWFRSVAHIETETLGTYQYEWIDSRSRKNDSGKYLSNYDLEELPPTSVWKRQITVDGKVVESF